MVIVLLAALLGTALGDLLGRAFPEQALGRFLSAGVRVGTTSPLAIDLGVAQLTFGASVRLTILGGLGAAAALVLFFRRV